jgi:hypothetical protein
VTGTEARRLSVETAADKVTTLLVYKVAIVDEERAGAKAKAKEVADTTAKAAVAAVMTIFVIITMMTSFQHVAGVLDTVCSL